MNVRMIATNDKFLKEITYTAFRNCYSPKTPIEIWDEIETNSKISEEQVNEFLKEKLKSKHMSPTRMVNFVFLIDGVSRSLTAQFNRHGIGVGRTEKSQRYVNFLKTDAPFITPPSFEKNEKVLEKWKEHQQNMIAFYSFCLENDVPKEDARFGLGLGSTSAEVVGFSFESLQHFLKERLCLASQWEIRKLAHKMLKEVKRQHPLIGEYLGIKCERNVDGMCDEPLTRYEGCGMNKKVPHKEILLGEYYE